MDDPESRYCRAVACIYGGVVWLTCGDESEAQPVYAAGALWLSLAVIVAAVLWSLLWQVLRAVGAFFRLDAFGNSLVPRLAALGIVLFAYPDALRTALTQAVWAVAQVALVIPAAIARGAQQIAVESRDRANIELLLRVAGQFLQEVEREFTTFGQGLLEGIQNQDIPISIALWAVVAIGIRAALDAKLPARFVEFIKQRPAFNSPNVGFTVILVVSTFLSLAAVTSLPRLRKTLSQTKMLSRQF